MQILEYQMLDVRNLLCCTTKFNPDSFAEALQKIEETLKNNEITSKDTAIYLLFGNDENQTINIHFATEKEITYPKDLFQFKERLYLVQAVKSRYEGELYDIKDSFYQIQQYMDTRKLSPITPFCCKVISGLEDSKNTGDVIVDIYVGVNGNII